MNFVLMAFAAAGIISGSTLGTRRNSSGASGRREDQGDHRRLRCTGGKIEKADYGYAVDDVKCKDEQEYEIKLDPNFKLIVMTRD